jgi:hypothetical protein
MDQLLEEIFEAGYQGRDILTDIDLMVRSIKAGLSVDEIRAEHKKGQCQHRLDEHRRKTKPQGMSSKEWVDRWIEGER